MLSWSSSIFTFTGVRSQRYDQLTARFCVMLKNWSYSTCWVYTHVCTFHPDFCNTYEYIISKSHYYICNIDILLKKRVAACSANWWLSSLLFNLPIHKSHNGASNWHFCSKHWRKSDLWIVKVAADCFSVNISFQFNGMNLTVIMFSFSTTHENAVIKTTSDVIFLLIQHWFHQALTSTQAGWVSSPRWAV